MSDKLPPLSEREIEILQLVATGAANQEIAHELFISVNTVKVHLRNIFAKLEVTSRTEATMVAVRRGWVGVPQATGPAPVEQGPVSASPPIQPDETPTARPIPALPVLERWPRVNRVRRAILVAALVLAIAALFLPQVLQSRSSERAPNAISGVFPTSAAAGGSSAGRWRTRAQMPTPRNGLAVVAFNGLIYAIGGVSNDGVSSKVEVYDPQADTWTLRSAKPTPAGFVSAIAIGDRIYVPGGIGPLQQAQNVLEVYDPAQDLWESLAPIPEPVAGYALTSLGGQLYLFGGLNTQGYVSSVYRYDPVKDGWQARQPLAEPRGLLGAAALGGRIYVVGGYNDANEFNACDIYDPATDGWVACRPMALRRGGLSLVAARNNLYAIGGGMGGYLAFNERYDPRVNLWSRIETPVIELWRGLGAAFVDPNLYAIGGWNGANLSVNEAYQALFYQIITVP